MHSLVYDIYIEALKVSCVFCGYPRNLTAMKVTLLNKLFKLLIAYFIWPMGTITIIVWPMGTMTIIAWPMGTMTIIVWPMGTMTIIVWPIVAKLNAIGSSNANWTLYSYSFSKLYFSSKQSLHPVTYMSSYTQMIFTTCLHHSFSSFSCCVSF